MQLARKQELDWWTKYDGALWYSAMCSLHASVRKYRSEIVAGVSHANRSITLRIRCAAERSLYYKVNNASRILKAYDKERRTRRQTGTQANTPNLHKSASQKTCEQRSWQTNHSRIDTLY